MTSSDAAARAEAEASPGASQDDLRREVQQRAQELAEGIRRISAEFAGDMVPRWKAHGARLAYGFRDRVAGLVVSNPDEAERQARELGLTIIRLDALFAQEAIAAAMERVWWRKVHGLIPAVSDKVWIVEPGTGVPVNEQGEVAPPPDN